jgi:Family of unknown function (DUF6338)
MPDLKGLENIEQVIALLVPGLIALFMRSQFITGRQPPLNEAILPYFVMTLIYYGLAFPLLAYVSTLQEPNWRRIAAWFLLVIIGPAIFGTLLGISSQRGYLRRLMRKLGLNPVHPSPTAWDWWFGQPHERWIIIGLKDGTKFYGYFGLKSFVSSDPKERDIFVEKVYYIQEDETWKDTGQKGLLVSQSEILTLEFFEVNQWRVPVSNPPKPYEQSDRQPTQQSKPTTEGYKPNPKAGYQPTTGSGTPSNPPNQGSSGKK